MFNSRIWNWAQSPGSSQFLAKKAEGRPITPEEYRELHNFNSRVESGLIKERREVTKQQQARIQAAKAAVPDDAYDLPIMTLGLATKVENLLNEAGYGSVGELAYRLLLVPKSISNIDGIGPSYIKQIEEALDVMIGYKPLSEEYDVEEDLVLDMRAGEVDEDPESAAEAEGETDDAPIDPEEPADDDSADGPGGDQELPDQSDADESGEMIDQDDEESTQAEEQDGAEGDGSLDGDSQNDEIEINENVEDINPDQEASELEVEE